MENFIKLIDVTIWPFTIMYALFLFRNELRRAALRISSLKYKDFSAVFNEDLQKIETQLTQIASDDKTKQLENEQSLSSYERLIRIVEISPRAAIMEAWRDIEITTKQVTEVYGIATIGHIAGVKAVRQLVSNGVLPEDVISVYESLRKLRAKAAHTAEFEIDPKEAERYIDTAHQFYMTLSFLLKQKER